MKTRKSLFDIGEDLILLEEALESCEGEETGEMEATILEFLGVAKEELADKVDRYLVLIAEKTAIAKARKEEAARLAALAKEDENLAKRLKTTLQAFLESRGMTKMETPRHKLAIAKNGGKAPVMLRVEPKDLPSEFTQTIISADTDAIRKALEAGEILDFAELGDKGTHLRIR